MELPRIRSFMTDIPHFFSRHWQSAELVVRRLKKIRAYFARCIHVMNVEGVSPVREEFRLARLGLR